MDWPAISTLPDVAGSNPASMLSTVVLPQPLVPEQAEELAGLYLQIEIADGNVVAALHGTENLVDARESNQRQGDAPKAQ